ncbi:NADH-quinone oxidoreductase subunit NuoF [Synechococcus sp. CBW1002]|uniref:NADH-quinone oxidoreductase subunit NuoF n=1 Tax=Synechococcus sp. CBW1002 TaxID=1353134 RepID=UPI0018CD1DE0|nr:NADH-quinone oxidoreductase subunit NuoF [Synechococcus sp. CBW1002]QPN58786.1 NADH-quinone oxidoreductase subunit NuoF [Synechococcus sp. CBW1002]
MASSPRMQLRCCGASGCRSAGAEAVRAALLSARDQLGGAAEAVSIKPVGCLRLCGRGPLVALDRPEPSGAEPACRTELYAELRPEQAFDLLARATGRGDALAAQRLDSDHPFFALQKAVVLEGCGVVDPESIDDALNHGTYAQLRRVLLDFSPEQVREQVKRSGLRGRGGAGYPTGLKWDTVALQPPGPRYVVCNADEGDPGAFMDRSVLESDPHRLIEGLAIAAYAVGAEQGYVYVRAEYPLAVERLRLALRQARAKGLLGAGIAGSGFHLRLEVRVGAGAYVCGEETALLASIQGQRGTPRPRPPFPAQSGLWGAPTLINNVETLASIPVILREGGDWYAAIGTEGSKGTKVFALSGAVQRTGLVEVPMGTTLRTVVQTIGGGVPGGEGPDKGVKAVQTGGPSGGCIPAHLLDTPVDYESLRALGSMMGSGGLVVMGESTSMPEVARHFMRFSVNESCGKCVPCRAGTVQLAQMLDRFVERRASLVDLERLEELCRMVGATSLCGLGQAAPNPVLSTLRYFRQEYQAACRDPDQCEPFDACLLKEGTR